MAHVINGIFYSTYHVQHTCGIFVPGVGPPGLCTLALLLNSQVIMQSLATCRQVPLCFRCTSTSQKCYQAQIYICSVLKDGRAFLGTLALDSNCIVWFTCFGVFALCALKLHIHPVDDFSFPLFSDLGFCMASCSYISVIKWRRSGFLEFTKLLLALSSFKQPFDRIRSIQEYVFIILSHRQACAGRFREETAGKKDGCGHKMAALEPSVHPVRNRLCYHFFIYQTNESCSRIVLRRLMLLRSLNKSYLRVTTPNLPRLNGHFMNALALFCTYIIRRLTS